ncbi:hypothetical protein ACJRO7_018539 [Eucalyptus globulus]|uniref:Uncharacterized protein n=1 Tax=Eucalyptus globulus TaxID=34317 RepID=A0ABD3L507_EUCGL
MSDKLGIGGDDADDGPEDVGEHHLDEGVFTSDKTPTPVHDKHGIDKTPNSKRRMRSESFGIASTCKALQEMIKSKASQSVSGSINSQVTSPPTDPYSVSIVIDLLLAMPTLESNLYNKAVERACVNATWREAFIKTPADRRYGLLQYL